MSYITKFGGYRAAGDLSSSDWTKRWNTATLAEVLGIGYEFIGAEESTADGTSYTFSGLITDIGQYVVGVIGQTSNTPGVDSVTVDGSSGNELLDEAPGGGLTFAFYLLEPSSFADGDITVNFATSNNGCAIVVWRVDGTIGATYDAIATAAVEASAALTTTKRNAVFGQAVQVGSASANDLFWSGITERTDDLVDGTTYRSAADLLLITDEAQVELVTSSNGTPTNSLWAAISFQTPVTYFPSGQGVEFTKESSNALTFWSWDIIPLLDDVEVLGLIRVTAQSDLARVGLAVRGGGSVGAESAYSFLLTQSSAGLRDTVSIAKHVADTAILDVESFSWSLDTNYWMRFRVRGSTLKARIWADGSTEPSTWLLDTADGDITDAGRSGVFQFYTGTVFELGHFEVKELVTEWPTDTIPNNWTINIQGGPQSNKVSFKPDIGPPIDRRRASAVNRQYQVSCPGLTQEEYLAFVEFYHTTLKEGTLPFMIMDPFTGQEKTFKFGSDNPAYQESIQRSPGPEYTNGVYQVDFSVIRLD